MPQKRRGAVVLHSSSAIGINRATAVLVGARAMRSKLRESSRIPVVRHTKVRSRSGSTQNIVEPAPRPPNVPGDAVAPKGMGNRPVPRRKKPSPRKAGKGSQPRTSHMPSKMWFTSSPV
jgi:hypothetical protein